MWRHGLRLRYCHEFTGEFFFGFVTSEFSSFPNVREWCCETNDLNNLYRAQLYRDYAYKPVLSIAEASTTGHSTHFIVDVRVGMKATMIPTATLAAAAAAIVAYHLGSSTGIGEGRNAGLFGTVVTTMGHAGLGRFCSINEQLWTNC